MTWTLIGMVLQALPAIQQPATAPSPTVITTPDWIRRPSADDVAGHFPKSAARSGLSGRATISCGITAKGTLENCTVISEAPVGEGFGEGAMRMSALFKMRPMTRNSVPVPGGIVRIPIRFLLPADLRSAPVRVTHGAIKGAFVELNCRYRALHLDNCFAFGSPTPMPEASEAAVKLAEGITLPSTPRPTGRIVIPMRFEP